MTDLSELEKFARAATPGPWFVDEDHRPGMEWNRHIYYAEQMAVCFMAHSDGKDPARDEATATYIAAMSPDTALKLIAVAKAAMVALETPGLIRGRDDLTAALQSLAASSGEKK